MLKVDTNELKTMKHTEGLVLQGCGGELQEQVEGINGLLKEEGIPIGDSKFHEVLVFEHERLTNLLFTFDGVYIDIGRLAAWRIWIRTQFGSTWPSDYVESQLDGFPDSVQKPDCPLTLTSGNTFDLMAVVSRTLKEQGWDGSVKQMIEQITNGDYNSYEDALNIIGEYVNITSVNNQAEEGMGINELEM